MCTDVQEALVSHRDAPLPRPPRPACRRGQPVAAAGCRSFRRRPHHRRTQQSVRSVRSVSGIDRYRYRTVPRTGADAALRDGRYRLVPAVREAAEHMRVGPAHAASREPMAAL